MPIKRIFLLLLLASLWGAAANAADIYFAQAAAGTGTGLGGCVNARAISSHGAGDDVPGNTLHTCGTLTGSGGATLLTIQGNGSSGNPLTIHGEAGSVITATWWPVTGGAISCNGHSFITIDNVTVQATANGTLLANHQDTRGIDCQQSTANNVIIQNSIVTNLYIRQEDSTSDGHESIAVSLGGSHTKALANHIDHARVGVGFGYCGETDLEIANNFISFSNHEITVGGNNLGCTMSVVRIHDNDFDGGAYLWDWPCPCPPGNAFHHNAIHFFASGGHATVTDVMVWNNYMHGSWGNDTAYLASSGGTHITGGFFFETIGPGIRTFNNIFAMSNPTNQRLTVPDNGYIVYKGGTGDPLEESRAAITVNNTLIQNIVSGNVADITTSVPGGHTWENNLTQGTGYHVFTANGDSAMATSDFNLFFNIPNNTWGGNPINQSLAQWIAGVGPGTESHSIFTNPLLGVTFIPSTGSPAINTGVNLTSLGIQELNKDKNGSPRPASGPWTIGALNPGNQPPAPSLTISPNSIPFGTVTIPASSSPQTATVTSNGTATATLGTIVATFSDPQFARTGGTCTPSQSLPVGTSCTVIVVFTPSSAGVKNATMIVGGNGGNATASMGLSGTGSGGVGTTSMSAAPASFDFGSVTQGTPSTDTQFLITNTGTTTITMSNPVTTFGGTNAADFSLGAAPSGACVLGQVLTPGQTCTKNIKGTPSIVGAESATVTFSATTTSATATLAMTGTAVNNPSLLITPRPVAFPNTNVGSTSSPIAATVTNNGNVTVTLAVTPVTVTGTNAADFHNSGTTCTPGLVLVVAGTCTINVTFGPAAAGARTANLTITGTTTTNTSALTGTGVAVTAPGIGLSPSGGVLFGIQIVGTTSSIQTVTVTSTGTGNLTLNPTYFTLSGTNAADVTNTGAGTCSNNKILGPGASCTVTLTFNPASAGARSATLNIAGNASASLPLSGTGIAAVVTLTAAPSPLPFGSVTQGTTSIVETLTITNTGNVAGTLSATYYTLTGANAADFTNTATGTCANGTVLAPAGSCTVKVTFTPTLLAAETGTLTVSAGAVNVPIALTGNGVAPTVPSISIAPNPVAFPGTNVGVTSSGLTATITDSGTADLHLSSPFYSLTGTNATDYARTGGTCSDSGTVLAGGFCTITLTFTPAAAGSRPAILNIFGDASKSANITGAGIQTAPLLSLTPNPRDFGVVTIGTLSGAMQVLVTNIGNASATLSPSFFTLTGANASDFTRTGGTCANGTVLAVSGSCTVLLTFVPSTTAGETATLTVNAGAVSGTAILTGTGQSVPISSGTPAPTPQFIIADLLTLPPFFLEEPVRN